MKKTAIITAILAVFVSLPISLYLWYKVLMAVEATELMWFLWIVNIPVAVLIRIIEAVIKSTWS